MHAIANGLVLFSIVYGLVGVLLLLFRFIKNKVVVACQLLTAALTADQTVIQALAMLITAAVLGLFTSITLMYAS